jgi:hypothetical protein
VAAVLLLPGDDAPGEADWKIGRIARFAIRAASVAQA